MAKDARDDQIGVALEDAPEITFDFIVSKVQSLADGSPRLVIDLQESDLPVAAMLWQAKLDGLVLHAKITVVKQS